MKRFLVSVLLVTSFGVTSPAWSSVFVSAERFGYTGSWTRHTTLADAQAGTNVVETGGMPQRDITFYISNGITESIYDPEFDILTRWYGPSSGNPNNTNEGFFQYYDADHSTVLSSNAWWNADLTEFRYLSHSEDADYPNDFARFGERAGGPGSATEAFFHEMDMDLLFSGLAGSFNSSNGRYEGTDTAGASIAGTISGIVQNVGTDSSRHGYYSFVLTLNNTSWAYGEGYVGTGEGFFSSDTVVPEPLSAVTFGLPLAFLWLHRRRRRRRDCTEQFSLAS